jgi:hypothetical protein
MTSKLVIIGTPATITALVAAGLGKVRLVGGGVRCLIIPRP